MYGESGTEPQYREFLRLADRQLEALDKERQQLEETIAELKKTRDEVEQELG